MDAKSPAYDVEAIRADFPILSREVYGKPLVYLDNGASAQKPQAGDRRGHQRLFENEYANVHRGLHYLSNTATDALRRARERAPFLNAPSHEQIIFTRIATEAINTGGRLRGGMPNIGEGDEIVISIMEHHSNIVPWHFHRERQGANSSSCRSTTTGASTSRSSIKPDDRARSWSPSRICRTCWARSCR
jgi:cysteine desulfurase/selenocysteine lyase